MPGKVWKNRVPPAFTSLRRGRAVAEGEGGQGQLNRNAVFSRPCGTDDDIVSDPGVQTPGYFQNVPAGHSFFGCPKIELHPQDRSQSFFAFQKYRDGGRMAPWSYRRT